jgi:hypothetical protein
MYSECFTNGFFDIDPIQFLNGYTYPLYLPQLSQGPATNETMKQSNNTKTEAKENEQAKGTTNIEVDVASPWTDSSAASPPDSGIQQDLEIFNNDFIFMGDYGMAYLANGHDFGYAQNSLDGISPQDTTLWGSETDYMR